MVRPTVLVVVIIPMVIMGMALERAAFAERRMGKAVGLHEGNDARVLAKGIYRPVQKGFQVRADPEDDVRTLKRTGVRRAQAVGVGRAAALDARSLPTLRKLALLLGTRLVAAAHEPGGGASLVGVLGDRSGEGVHLGNLGIAYRSLGRYAEAIEHHTQALAISREIGDRGGEGGHLGSLQLRGRRCGPPRRGRRGRLRAAGSTHAGELAGCEVIPRSNGWLHRPIGQTSQGSFSAVSRPHFASKYARNMQVI